MDSEKSTRVIDSPTLLSLMESTPTFETSTSSLPLWPSDHLRLLAVAEDFIRQNVEVFIATKDDVACRSFSWKEDSSQDWPGRNSLHPLRTTADEGLS
jgi:hypothetical protein